MEINLYAEALRISQNFFNKFDVYDNEEYDKYAREDFIYGVLHDMENNHMTKKQALQANIDSLMPEYEVTSLELDELVK